MSIFLKEAGRRVREAKREMRLNVPTIHLQELFGAKQCRDKGATYIMPKDQRHCVS